MVIIDTSSWVEMLRQSGRPEVRARVNELLATGRARLVSIVLLELWNGARGEHEKRGLREIKADVPELEITGPIWEQACRLAEKARAAGMTVPVPDILIVACARHYGAAIESADAHFAPLAKL